MHYDQCPHLRIPLRQYSNDVRQDTRKRNAIQNGGPVQSQKKKTEDQLPSQCLRDASCFSFGGPRCVASSIAFGICPCIRARPISFEARPTATQELIKTDKQPPSKRKQHSSSKRDFLTKPPEKEKTACLGRHHHHHHSSARRARTRTLACGQASSISIYKCRVHSFRQCPLYRFCFFS